MIFNHRMEEGLSLLPLRGICQQWNACITDHNLPMAWSQLKAVLSDGEVTKLKGLMQKIENNPDPLLRFQELTEQIQLLHKTEIKSPFALSEYCDLQQSLRKEYDYALCQLWSQIQPYLKGDDLPQAEDASAIQKWLNDPAHAPELSKITTLILVDLNLTMLPEEIGKLAQLKTLCLTGNYLTTLPEAIGELSALENLELGHNWLTALPKDIGKLSILKVLMLDGNRLVALPDTIGELAELRVLSLQDNSLVVLPESIGNLSHLFTLDIDGNRLTSLPTSMRNLTDLKILRLSNNPIPNSALELVDLLSDCDMGF